MENYRYRQLMRRTADFKLFVSIAKDIAVIAACGAIIWSIWGS
jgi:hypothetical protein